MRKGSHAEIQPEDDFDFCPDGTLGFQSGLERLRRAFVPGRVI